MEHWVMLPNSSKKWVKQPQCFTMWREFAEWALCEVCGVVDIAVASIHVPDTSSGREGTWMTHKPEAVMNCDSNIGTFVVLVTCSDASQYMLVMETKHK